MLTPTVRGPRLRWSQLRRSTKLCVLLLLLLLTTGGLELGSRVYWAAVHHTHGTSAETIWRTFYPEVAESGIDRVAANHGDDSFDVLLLGGSVVTPRFANIGDRLASALEVKMGRKVRVVTCAFQGRTSLDSRMKYEHFTDKRWDLVVVYHGINDVVLNNCPPGAFRADYSIAYRRYGMQYDLKRHPEVGHFALPYTATFLGKSLMERWGLTVTPRGEYEKYGNDIRTPPSFEANLEAIAAAAERRGDPLVLSTFAYYLPADYTDEAFTAGRLDYARPFRLAPPITMGAGKPSPAEWPEFAPHGCPAATWGEPRNIARTIDLHNEAVRRVAGRHGLQLIDQRANMPDGKQCYYDCCHLTDEGSARWVENVMNTLDCSKIGRSDGAYRASALHR